MWKTASIQDCVFQSGQFPYGPGLTMPGASGRLVRASGDAGAISDVAHDQPTGLGGQCRLGPLDRLARRFIA